MTPEGLSALTSHRRLLKAHCAALFTGNNLVDLRSLIDSDVSRFIRQQNWQFVSGVEHQSGEVDSFHLLRRS